MTRAKTYRIHAHQLVGDVTLGFERAFSPEAAWAQLRARIGIRLPDQPDGCTAIEEAHAIGISAPQDGGVQVLFEHGVPVRVALSAEWERSLPIDRRASEMESRARRALRGLVWPEATVDWKVCEEKNGLIELAVRVLVPEPTEIELSSQEAVGDVDDDDPMLELFEEIHYR